MSVKIINIADLVDHDDAQRRTYREVNHTKKHTFVVGQLVEIDDGVRLFVAKQTRDCDGTPLYMLTPFKHDHTQDKDGFANKHWLNGVCGADMKVVQGDGYEKSSMV